MTTYMLTWTSREWSMQAHLTRKMDEFQAKLIADTRLPVPKAILEAYQALNCEKAWEVKVERIADNEGVWTFVKIATFYIEGEAEYNEMYEALRDVEAVE